MYFIELIATKKCNQKCYYCTTYSEDKEEVDIDYLKYVLDCCPDETGVEITGGEIGLLTNLDEFYKTVKNHKHVKHIIALSNGLIRKIGVDWLNDVEYWEHLIYEIKGREISKFYDLDLKQKHRYVIVTTESTTSSLLTNWNYFESVGLFKKNFFYKLLNHKSTTNINKYFDDLCKLYLKIDNVYFQRMLIYYYALNKFNKTIYDKSKDICQKYSPNPFIDLQTKQLGHCAINITQSIKVGFNKENLQKMMKGEFSKDAIYCQKCYSFDNGKNRNMLNNRSYK
jgi:organic radical activating enzyme